MTDLSSPLTLPCGLTLLNRIAKAAMTEQIAGPAMLPGAPHARLYRRWAEGGAGLLITGNVMVDARYPEHPANVAIDEGGSVRQKEALAGWAEAARSDGAAAIVQLSHAGRQTPKACQPRPIAPSAVPLGLPGGQFAPPRAMSQGEIHDTRRRFAAAARACAEAGFDGVQIHAAHGYLLSSFLSPRSNRRDDVYGGSLENRARLLLQITEQVKAEAPEGFAVSVKLNSSDFQKGGFDPEDSLKVAGWLAGRGVDLLEISGGSYEQPAMMDMDGLEARHEETKRESTRQREAYFLDFAERLREHTDVPLMVTGGFRTKPGMEAALASGALDVIGLARPLCVEPDLPARLLSGDAQSVPSYEKRLSLGPGPLGPNSPLGLVKALNGFAVMSFFYENIRRMSQGREPKAQMPLLPTFLKGQARLAGAARSRQKG